MQTGKVLAGTVAAAALLSAGGVAAASRDGGLAPATVLSGQVQFDTAGPARVYDSREYQPGDGSRFQSGTSAHIPLAGQLDAPDRIPIEAKAVLVNLTVVVKAPGHGFLAAHGPTWQGNSTVNWSTPGTYTNVALVPVTDLPSGARTMQVRVEGNAAIDVIVDLTGWVAV